MSRDRATIAAAFAATAVALRARTGPVEGAVVARLEATVAARLDGAHPLRGAVARFAGRYRAVRRDPEALAEAGAALQADVAFALRPAPAGLDRADIHG